MLLSSFETGVLKVINFAEVCQNYLSAKFKVRGFPGIESDVSTQLGLKNNVCSRATGTTRFCLKPSQPFFLKTSIFLGC